MGKIRNQRGSITVITIVTILFMLAFLGGTYAVVLNRRQAQVEMNRYIKETYEKEVDNVDEVYNVLIAKTQNKVCKHDFVNNVCKKCGFALEIGANIIGYDSSIDAGGKTINTSYAIPVGLVNNDGSVISGSRILGRNTNIHC